MRWWKNLKWLFNHPPTSINVEPFPANACCDYCGKTPDLSDGIPLWRVVGIYCICEQCRKKVFDKVLLVAAGC